MDYELKAEIVNVVAVLALGEAVEAYCEEVGLGEGNIRRIRVFDLGAWFVSVVLEDLTSIIIVVSQAAQKAGGSRTRTWEE